jgi:sRNA-binding protein
VGTTAKPPKQKQAKAPPKPKGPARQPPDPERAKRRHEKTARQLAEHGLTLGDVDTLTATLMQRWPMAFNPLHRRALAIGIHHTILAGLGCHPVALSLALKRWTAHHRYQRALALGHHRHDLQGEDVAELTAAEHAMGQAQMKRLRERWQAQMAARGEPKNV